MRDEMRIFKNWTLPQNLSCFSTKRAEIFEILEFSRKSNLTFTKTKGAIASAGKNFATTFFD